VVHSTLKDTLCHQLSSTGLRQQDVYNIIRDVELWTEKSGPEWTVGRLKSLKNEFVTRLGGEPVLAPWVSRSRDGLPKGSWGRLVSLSKSRKGIQKRLSALMVYADLRAPHGGRATPAQERKFFSAVESIDPLEESQDIPRRWVQIWHRAQNSPTGPRAQYVKFREASRINPTLLLPVSDSRRAPVIPGPAPLLPPSPWQVGFVDKRVLGRSPRTVRESDISAWFPSAARSEAANKLRSAHPGFDQFVATLDNIRTGGNLLSEKIRGDLRYKRWATSGFPVERVDLTGDIVGTVSFLQEPGYKLRSVANPNRLVQGYLRPLQTYLFSVLSEIDSDCTYDQEKGIARVQQWMRDGETVGSVDLSSATDRFPLTLIHASWCSQWSGDSETSRLLRADWQLFLDVSRGEWSLPKAYGDRTVRWTNGQPLGLGPSFAAFAYAHHAMVRNLGVSPEDYVILGDDIVLKGKHNTEAYIDLMTGIGCEISHHKTVISSSVAEFAGRVITPSAVYTQPKWRVPSDRSFLDWMRNMGPSGLFALRPRQREVAAQLMEVPEELGGLGLNPNGIPYGVRYEKAEALMRETALEPRQLAGIRQVAVLVALREPFGLASGTGAVMAPGQGAFTRGRSVKETIVLNQSPPEITDPDLEGIPGYVLGVPSDPRGRTTLEVWTERINAAAAVDPRWKPVRRSPTRRPTTPDRAPTSQPHWLRQPPRPGRGLGR